MALFPIFAGQREAVGLFNAHSTDYAASSEGGLVVQLKADGTDLAVANHVGTAAATSPMFGLLDEQAETTKETMLGKYIPKSLSPIVLGPATYLASGKVSVWVESGWFLTDKYNLAIDGYGEATALNPGDPMLATAGVLGAAGGATRIYFSKMIEDAEDLLFSYVTPVPVSGMFAEKAPILIYQA